MCPNSELHTPVSLLFIIKERFRGVPVRIWWFLDMFQTGVVPVGLVGYREVLYNIQILHFHTAWTHHFLFLNDCESKKLKKSKRYLTLSNVCSSGNKTKSTTLRSIIICGFGIDVIHIVTFLNNSNFTMCLGKGNVIWILSEDFHLFPRCPCHSFSS